MQGTLGIEVAHAIINLEVIYPRRQPSARSGCCLPADQICNVEVGRWWEWIAQAGADPPAWL